MRLHVRGPRPHAWRLGQSGVLELHIDVLQGPVALADTPRAPGALEDSLREPVALVVEDHEAVRHALCEWITKSFGRCRVREARNVEDALAIVESEAVDVVLMDVHLPGTNGIDGTRAVLERSPHTAVIAVSNYDDSSHRAAAAEAGVKAFVPKRAIRKELTPILRELLVFAVFAKNPALAALVND